LVEVGKRRVTSMNRPLQGVKTGETPALQEKLADRAVSWILFAAEGLGFQELRR